jgi:molecular chaperone GrpE
MGDDNFRIDDGDDLIAAAEAEEAIEAAAMADVELADEDAAAEEAAAAVEAEVMDPRDVQITELKNRVSDLNDQLLRTAASAQNIRRRSAQDLQLVRKFAAEPLAQEILPILDNFERTQNAVKKGASPEAILKGFTVIQKQLKKALESQGVNRMEVVGKVFDPEKHDALAVIETSEFDEDIILNEAEAGYEMHDKVIRPARVQVSKKPESK